jgi:UDP-GlcNAc:undecaprenyl-phosphate GlcNAc-1-phosphate transferase
MNLNLLDLLPVALAFLLALALTPLVRALARRWGMVARPRADRWHTRPTALLGGVAILIPVAIIYFALMPCTRRTLVVMGASAFMGLVGLVDDFLHIKPYQKLIGQVMAAAVVIPSGQTLPWTAAPLANAALTLVWLVGITNAINLLDNMDGLAAGVAAIAALFLGVHFYTSGQTAEALMLAALAAALGGFLVYNANPASIFMGDCGALFLGFFLASAALLSTSVGGRSQSFLPVLVVPVLTLLIPIFDTTLVTILRKLAGRSASQGGRDHTSHRLVALGLSERHAVRMLYGFAVLSGFLALGVREMEPEVALAAVLSCTVLFTLLGVHLAGVKVYDEAEVRAAREKPLVAFLVDLSYKRRVFEVLLDVVLIGLSYFTATYLRFGSITENGDWDQFLRAVAVLVFIKMAVFLAAGVYRGLWRYLSVADLVVFARAVVISSAASVLVLVFLFRFEGFSRGVFVLDGVILFGLLGSTRLAFRLFRSLLPARTPDNGRRVLIYGAGDGGELLLRELLNNRALPYVPVGFVDDDPQKTGKRIHGLRVLGGNGLLPGICRRERVAEIILSSEKFTDQRVQEIVRECDEVQVAVKRMRIVIEQVSGTNGTSLRA